MASPDVTQKRKAKPAHESSAFIMGDNALVEQLEPGIRRQLLGFNDQIMAARVWFEKDVVGSMHAHPHTQLTYIESGAFEVTIGDITKRLSAGDSFYVAPGVNHGSVCREAGALVDMFAPIREDFLQGGNTP
ncbi:hypothetical protein JCM17845_09500 [Iodidimonas gelatinilytica]|uniref:Cupin type-2 domain-containing protein n=1 Tax=Iodidimonas gelatinilytica TaxID=1236966 RepID=A0A5A7MWW0_9PROT|nr:cupin domain-containing protein [Iodidimonas gelatinilytica]GER00327.1 hypothetical protein JCM17845_09500 [Iodidimonas gelatinilytica]